ncbi:hypothetical protein HYS31_08640 [Candidatus Woesearchaeota archaeon]|nr:hypothetical protein [Candidatus Woesearchaeota archaeon]
MENNDKYVIKGLLGSAALLAFYFIVASLLGGVSFAVDNFVKLWYWMVPLVIGFGIQIGMFFYVKEQMHAKAMGQAAASTGMSATSMVACCAHHIADVAPFLGISALGLFFTKYQSTFLLMGVLSNILGIAYMYRLVNVDLPKQKMKVVFYSLLAVSVIAVGLSYWFVLQSEDSGIQQGIKQGTALQPLASNQNNVEFSVTPLSASQFQIAIDTHSVNLDFDLAQISVLYDDLGNIYKPLKWEGSEPGGHHRSGTLIFPKINENAKSIKLVITDSAAREFNWDT